ncbi:MAG: PRC-barrel domain-containing protein [Ardenticatenales bacterium]|nr:PRC-barrel domain-containing protein [Ardenticatenales bacterium]
MIPRFHSVATLRDLPINGTDGEIGKLNALYFDDLSWQIRYLAVDLGNWFTEDIVLIIPDAVIGLGTDQISLGLTRQQIKDSPPLRADQPISREYEARLYDYYQWRPYWYPSVLPGEFGGVFAVPPLTRSQQAAEVPEASENHLRSTAEVIGYKAQLTDENTAKVADFIVDRTNWTIAYLVADTGGWFGHHPVAVLPTWIENINWVDREVQLDLSADTLEAFNQFDLGKLNEQWRFEPAGASQPA